MKKLIDIRTSVLAKFLDVTPPFVSRVKKGGVKLSVSQCLKINDEFGIPLTELRPDVYPEHLFPK